MQGDAASLHRLAVILLDNAIKYAGTGGAVTLRLAAAGSQAVLTVHNTGTPIPPDREVKCSQFPSCVDFTGFNCIQNCVYCYYLSFFSKIALKHRPHYFHI